MADCCIYRLSNFHADLIDSFRSRSLGFYPLTTSGNTPCASAHPAELQSRQKQRRTANVSEVLLGQLKSL